MSGQVRSFDSADDVVELPALRSDLVDLGAVAVARSIHLPGWRWSESVRPAVGTEWCETRHVGYVVRGHLHFVLSDGGEHELTPGIVYDMPAGHDAWVVGDEPFECVEWMGTRTWLPIGQGLPGRILATLVFTDLVGSTQTAERLGHGRWSDLITAYEQAARDGVSRFGGVVVKLTGDGVLAMFDGAGRAVRCAVLLNDIARQLGLASRAAVHTGEVERTEGDLHGVAVHAAARMMALGDADDVMVSATTRDLITDPDLDFTDRGEHTLRGLAGTYRMFGVASG